MVIVGSSHFVNFDLLEKMPCPMFPYPTLQMGYQLTPEQAREKWKPPSNRHSPTPIKKTKCSNLTEMITCDDDSVSETLPATSRSLMTNVLTHQKIPLDVRIVKLLLGNLKKLKDEVIYWRRLYIARQQKPLNLDILSLTKR